MANGLALDDVAAFAEPRHREYWQSVAEFCAAEIGDSAPPGTDDEARRRARELARAMGRAGIYQPIADGDIRGCIVARELLGWWSPLADAVFALQALSSTPALIARGSLDGSESEEDGGEAPHPAVDWARRALAGDAIGAFAMTEPEAGSDPASMRTLAILDEGSEGDRAGYRLTGTKTFISNAGIADFYVVFASTAPSEGARGISCFVVPADTEGLRFAGPQVMSAPHPLGEIRLGDCRVPAGTRLGAEGRGFALAMATLDRLRPTVGAAACGMAGRALWEASEHARSRRQFGRPLGSFQLVQEKLAQSATELAAGRLLAWRAGWAKDSGADRITTQAAMAKAFCTEAAQRIVDRAVQVLGGRGVLANHPVDHLYRSVRALRIYEGATEVLQLVIARDLLREDRAADGRG